MMNKLKENTKVKLISLLSAIILWMYVMAVVDPDDTKLFEDVPVIITNLNELKDRDLVIYPEKELTTDIYVTGKLSNIQKVTKSDINVYGQIDNPIEGKNEIHLKLSTSQRISADFKNPVMVVTLEKIIEEERSITVNIEGSGKNNVDTIALDKNIDKVSISGPRTLVDEVKDVVGTVNVEGENKDFSQDIKLQPIDKKGNVVEGVELSQESIKANVTLLTKKEVPIKLNLQSNITNEIDRKNYTLSQNTVMITGKKDIIDPISYIDTQDINIDEILDGDSKDIYLNIPVGVTTNIKYITIKRELADNVVAEYKYTAQELEIRNNTNSIEENKIIIPDEISVSIEYINTIGPINKEDITLYIDLSELSSENNTCKINYESKYKIEKISINPDTIKVETA
ncbi:CdaR family protein [Romboutsia sp. 13368]|uniref:CdaR family protein n=1 Tax=Romboutsia sp. 13368 TaxID=2708053 RepID=UPI0025DCBD34|nr:CdaR family protein [Romboutsia sp. 13368]